MSTIITLSMLLVFTYLATSSSTIPTHSNPPNNFIKVSCSATLYPTLCVQSLSTYATTIQQSPKQLAQAALSVSLDRARSAASFVSQKTKLKGMEAKEYGAVKDCVENMLDSVDMLNISIKELRGLMGGVGEDEFMLHMNNVQTWVSAALTDEDTCVDGFQGPAMEGKTMAAINDRVVNVAQVTSNALALINQVAERH